MWHHNCDTGLCGITVMPVREWVPSGSGSFRVSEIRPYMHQDCAPPLLLMSMSDSESLRVFPARVHTYTPCVVPTNQDYQSKLSLLFELLTRKKTGNLWAKTSNGAFMTITWAFEAAQLMISKGYHSKHFQALGWGCLGAKFSRTPNHPRGPPSRPKDLNRQPHFRPHDHGTHTRMPATQQRRGCCGPNTHHNVQKCMELVV
jgi:hypothetical protein